MKKERFRIEAGNCTKRKKKLTTRPKERKRACLAETQNRGGDRLER